MLSCVLILPDDQVASGNAVGAAMGWGSDNYTIPLSADGTAPATHYGLHAWVAETFQALVESGVYPPELADAGITETDYDAMMAALVYSFWPEYTDHFATVCAEQGIIVVEA